MYMAFIRIVGASQSRLDIIFQTPRTDENRLGEISFELRTDGSSPDIQVRVVDEEPGERDGLYEVGMDVAFTVSSGTAGSEWFKDMEMCRELYYCLLTCYRGKVSVPDAKSLVRNVMRLHKYNEIR